MIDTIVDRQVEASDHLSALTSRAAVSIWGDYMAMERTHLRKQALRQLDRFIDEVLQEPEDVRKKWVKTVCRIMFDHPDSTLLDTFDNPESRIIVRFPLVEKILAPELVDLYATAKLPYGRWLYCLGGRRLNEISPELGDENGFVDNLDFLRGLLSADPEDHDVARILIFELHQAIELTEHHFPEEETIRSEGFRGRIVEFLELVVKYGERDTWSKTIEYYSQLLRRPHRN